MNEIKRKTELYICGVLANRVAGHTFVPFTGGSASSDADEIEPPFTVVAIDDAIKSMATIGTWELKGTVQIITHIAEATSEAHSALVRSIYVAFGYACGPYSEASFAVSGMDITGMRSNTSTAMDAHADIIDFTAGVGG